MLAPEGGDEALEDAALGWRGDVGAGWGRSLAWAGDTDGDGLGELLVGGEGQAALVGWQAGWSGISGARARLVGEGSEDLGAAVAGAGDLDGDGRMDLLVGAPDADRGASDGGAAYLVFGPVSGALGVQDVDAVILGDEGNGLLGSALAGGLDGDLDGRADLLIGSPGEGGGAGGVGVVYGGW